MNKGRQRGGALITVILMMIVLFVLLNSLTNVVSRRAHQGRLHYEQASGLYILEAGVADCLTQLETSMGWTEGFRRKTLANLPEDHYYAVRFNTTGRNFQPDDSINNLTGSDPADGPRGWRTVPAGTAELVVVAHAGGTVRRLRVMVAYGLEDRLLRALTATRNVQMIGDVSIRSQDRDEESRSRAGIHSNRTDNVPDIIRWRQASQRDRCVIHGTVSSSSDDPRSVDFGADPSKYKLGALKLNQPPTSFFNKDVIEEVSTHAGLPPPPRPDGNNQIAIQENRIGDVYVDGDFWHDGDLYLGRVSMYVDGDFTLNGHLEGVGTIFSSGDTTIYGRQNLSYNREEGVTIYSRGNVSLLGFNPFGFLETVEDPALQESWAKARQALGLLTTVLAEPPETLIAGGSRQVQAQELRRALATESVGPSWQGRRNLLSDVRDKLRYVREGANTGRTMDALRDLERLLADSKRPGQDLEAWRSGNRQGAILDALLQSQDVSTMEEVAGEFVGVLGAGKKMVSSFVGLVYTQSAFYSANDLRIMGAVWAAASSEDASTPHTFGDGTVAYPGDIVLRNGVSLQYRKSLVEDLAVRTGFGNPVVRSWVEL
ncbi:MAG: hypothetical protein HY319_01340 [Armatimonadetes bacterium]|nr:hypothetical protein [Armatimonadota bacterium]